MSTTALLMTLKSFWSANGVYILAVLFASSESLASMPKIKANSVLQLILNIIITITKTKK